MSDKKPDKPTDKKLWKDLFSKKKAAAPPVNYANKNSTSIANEEKAAQAAAVRLGLDTTSDNESTESSASLSFSLSDCEVDDFVADGEDIVSNSNEQDGDNEEETEEDRKFVVADNADADGNWDMTAPSADSTAPSDDADAVIPKRQRLRRMADIAVDDDVAPRPFANIEEKYGTATTVSVSSHSVVW